MDNIISKDHSTLEIGISEQESRAGAVCVGNTKAPYLQRT